MSHHDLQVAGLIAMAVVAVLLIVVALPVVLSMRHAARDREFQHAERLRALELGQPMPGDPATEGSSGHGGIGIGVWVPIGALVIALAATRSSEHSTEAAVAIWVAAGWVGVAGVICGTILAARAPSRDARSARNCAPTKPPIEEDDVDTVSRRGL